MASCVGINGKRLYHLGELPRPATPRAPQASAMEIDMNAQAKHADGTDDGRTRTWVDRVEVAGNQLIDRIEELVRDGNAKRVILRTSGGDELMTVPLTVGVVAGGLITLSAPMLAALGAVTGLVSRVTLEIEREGQGPAANETRVDGAEVAATPPEAPPDGHGTRG